MADRHGQERNEIARKERAPVSAIIDAALAATQPWIDAANHRVTVSIKPRALTVDADPTRLSQVLATLLTNGEGTGRSITIDAERAGDDVVIQIADGGAEHDAAELARIVEVPARILERQGGWVRVEREGLARRFIVGLPYREEDALRRDDERATSPRTGGRGDTDRSLRDEREKTDEELAKRRAVVEERADAVVELARARAAAVVDRARARADKKLDDANASSEERVTIARERATEDAAVDNERAIARQRLALERADGVELIAELLLLERQQTDRHLATERGHADAAIAARDDFLGVVSHDLRSLLHAINLSAWEVLHELGDAPETSRIGREALRIRKNVRRMTRLIGDLLDVTSIDAGKLRIEPAQNDAATVLRDTAEAFAPVAAASEIELRTEVGAEPLVALFDHDRIVQVLAKLVSNAIKHTPAGGRIELVARRAPKAIEFVVRDTGVGIPRDKLGSIFDRFAQGSDDRRGLGLGLYISRSLVEAHGGRLSVESTPGEGSTFTVRLPAR